MARSWRNKHGVGIGGLLIDTLAYNFLASTSEYDEKSYLYYDFMCRDFFKYLSDLPNQDRYSAPGSNQHVKVKNSFQQKAKKAHKLCVAAIDAEDTIGANDKWKKVFGRPFPSRKETANESLASASSSSWKNTEEFIEDRYPVDIRYALTIDCEVKQNGFRENRLSKMLAARIPLLAKKSLVFSIVKCDVPDGHSIEWKVLNRGEVAKQRDMIRGQIVPDTGSRQKFETTDFTGDHVVECYAVLNGVVVAKDRIHVPINTNIPGAS